MKNKGFKETIAGDFEISWDKEDLEKVRKTIIKKFNAEIHSQATLEGVQDLMREHPIDVSNIEKIMLNTFDVAYNIIGGGEEGKKKNIHTKEEADHSLPYMMSALLLDGNVLPEQYAPDRIQREDVQQLLQKVEVREKEEYSKLFPSEMTCDITIRLYDGNELHIEKKDYEGFYTHPASWETIINKFNALSEPYTDLSIRESIIDIVRDIENYKIGELMHLMENLSA